MAGAIGPALDELAEQNGTDLGTIGTIFLIGLIGAMPAQAITGMVSDRYGPRLALLGGMALIGTGTLIFTNSQHIALALAIYVFIALGFGSVDVGYNILIAEVHQGRVNVMNLLHTFFGVGAVASPAFASLTLGAANTALPGMWIGSLLMLGLIPLAFRLPADAGKPAPTETSAETPAQPFSYRTSLLGVMGAIMLVYVGIELGTGNWTPAYLERSTSLSESTAALATSGFWFALTASRVIMSLIGERFTARRVMWMSALGSVVGCGLMAISTGSAVLSIMGVLIAGFVFGPVYPTMIAIVIRAFRSGPGKAASIAAMLGGIGGGVLPWLQGMLLDRVSPAASVIMVGTGAAVMLGLWVWAVPQLMQRERAAVAMEPEPAPVMGN
jgi:FHS family glucose/mannose:H+ symporter-like MFS transporter